MTAGLHGMGGARAVDGVLFDIDDTLVDTRASFGQALAGIAEQYLPGVAPDRAGEVLDHWRADSGGRYREFTRGETTYRAQRMARANDLHAAFGGPVLDDAGFDAWDAVFEERFRTSWAAHADAAGVVDRLLAAGVAVGALSNAVSDYQASKLTRVGLHDRVPMLVGVDTLGVGKPDPRVFAEACRRLGTAPERTAYVGDELDIDARAATAAGLVGVWLDRPGVRPPGGVVIEPGATDVVIHSLTELPAVLGI